MAGVSPPVRKSSLAKRKRKNATKGTGDAQSQSGYHPPFINVTKGGGSPQSYINLVTLIELQHRKYKPFNVTFLAIGGGTPPVVNRG